MAAVRPGEPVLRLAPDLTLPLEAVTQTFAILAKRGVGKTYTAAVLVEELLNAHLHVCVVDPIGVWWGLRAGADGTAPGLPIIVLGGEHGDVPLEVTAGAIIADFIIDEGQSVVLDLALFRKGEQTRFMTDFAERLYHRNRAPLHLVLDEADAFAPQRPQKGQERMLGAIEDLVRRGRARGLGITLVTQRAAVLNKDVLTQVEVLIALRTIAPQDRDAIDAWVRVHGTPAHRDALMTSLPALPVGTAWFWSPGWLDLFQRVQVRRRETFDSSATPAIGATPASPRRLAEVDLGRLRERIAATIERATANDPQELRRRITELERRLRDQPPATRAERVEVPVLTEEQVARLEQVAASLTDLAGGLLSVARVISAALAGAVQPAETPPQPTSPLPPPASGGPAETATFGTGGGAFPSGTPGVPLRAGERKMLQTLARRVPLKVTRAQLGTLAGFTPSGGTFSTYLGTLKRAGLVVETSGEVTVTPVGLDVAGVTPTQPQTTEEVLALWRGALRAGKRKLLDALVAVYPRQLPREELAARAGFAASGGTFSTYLGTLRRNGLADVAGDDVRASRTLFIDGETPRVWPLLAREGAWRCHVPCHVRQSRSGT